MGKSESPTAVIGLACFVAFACPFLFGYGTLPLTNYAGEIVSLTGFATLLVVVTRYGRLHAPSILLRVYWAAIGTMILIMCAQYGYFGQRNLLAWVTAGGYFLLAGLAAWVGRAARASRYQQQWLWGLTTAIVAGATTASLAAIAQYLNLDASVIILSPAVDAGRTFGFIRQPNHQATFLNFGLIAMFVLLVKIQRTSVALLLPVLCPLVIFGIVSTGSRTGLIQLIFISAWAIPFLRANGQRVWKAAYPLAIAGLTWLVLFELDRNGVVAFYGSAKLAQTASEGVGLRSAVWWESVELIFTRPWLGWGIPAYASAFYVYGAAEKAGIVMTHSHNLFLQLAFAFGIPATALVTFLVGKILWSTRLQVLTPEGFVAFMAIGCVLIHSQVEFPLWYMYFLLPTSFFVGWISRSPVQSRGGDRLTVSSDKWVHPSQSNTSVQKGVAAFLAACTIGAAVWVNNDYYKITPVFTSGLKSDLEQRLAVARTGTWFKNYVGYLDLIRQKVNQNNHEEYLLMVRDIGCSIYEIWYQPNTIVALAYAGRVDEAKWVMYSYWRLGGGEVEPFKNALLASEAPQAAELVRYLNSPFPVAKAAGFFDDACYLGFVGQ